MIALQLEGRLGNQLFQYAFIYSAAKRLETSFYIDKSIERFVLPQYFEIENDFLMALDRTIFSIRGFKNMFSVYARKSFYQWLGDKLFKENKIIFDNRTPVKDIISQLKNGYIYKGYFHSESYFEDFKEEIRDLYKIKKRYARAFEKVKRQVLESRKKAVVHIRRGDYVGFDLSLPASYYKEAIKMIDCIDMYYIFISDDPSFIEREFDYIPNKYISVNSEIIDLQFLMDADFCILSNSSFSWWGAWLNNKANKQVVAPKYWLGYKDAVEYPVGIAEHMNFSWIDVQKTHEENNL